jgi:hypothetical protein
VSAADRKGPTAVGVLFAILVTLAALNAWLASALQPPAGDGHYGATAEEFVGTLSRAPYPMLRRKEGAAIKTYLLVSSSKRGAEATLGVTPNGPVKISGHLIARASISMIEIEAGDAAVISETDAVAEPPREVHGWTSIEGEIVASKCWLGAMRPGEGPSHRGCAALCIAGGIPPLLIAAHGSPRAYMMTQADGRAIAPETVADYVGAAIRIGGTVERRGDLWVFKADPATIELR